MSIATYGIQRDDTESAKESLRKSTGYVEVTKSRVSLMEVASGGRRGKGKADCICTGLGVGRCTFAAGFHVSSM